MEGEEMVIGRKEIEKCIHSNGYKCNNSRTVGNSVFYVAHAKDTQQR
jgi:hypothetical protein